MGESQTLAKERGAREGKSGLYSDGSQVLSRRGRTCKENLRKKHEQVSGRKSSLGVSTESWFHFKSEMGKEVERRRTRL